MSTQQSESGPWRPNNWALGGIPKKNVDIPVTAMFLFLYIVGAAVHMTIFQLNRRRGHKFLFSGMIFGFCMARITTCVLRLASISLPSNIRLAIAASIFVSAGVLLLFIINLLWSQRILRAHHPLGWHPHLRPLFTTLYTLTALTLALVITGTVQSFYTLRPRTRAIDRALQLTGATFFLVISFLPLPLIALSLLLNRKPQDPFGAGRHTTKLLILALGTALLCTGAGFRAGTSWHAPVPLSAPEPWYFHRGYFYFVNFGIEILVVALYAVMRVDLRFWVPDGAKGLGSYGGAGKDGEEKVEA